MGYVLMVVERNIKNAVERDDKVVKLQVIKNEYGNILECFEFNYLIKKFVGRLKDEIKILTKWETYLQEKLSFPFQAEVVESQESQMIREGDKLKVI